MQRVLIADDNSNIQKMVSLALKDAGIEVIAVNNGEAAVRKMPEVSPDLVLADIFMPVRSGYEVCEFVKRDPRFMHTPVVLLAGAFDPFDENEAQRVQADGVLKKPFVPPDPLVNMVMALLSKSASEKLVPVGVAVSPAADARSLQAEIAKHMAPVGEDAVAEPFTDDPPEEFKIPAEGLSFSDDKTLAFGSLLDAPSLPVEPESVVTATRDPVLGDPAFWAPAEVQEAPSVDDLTDGHSWEEPIPEAAESSNEQPANLDLSLDAPSIDYFTEEIEEPAATDLEASVDHASAIDMPPTAEHNAGVAEAENPAVGEQPETTQESAVVALNETETVPESATSEISEPVLAVEQEAASAPIEEFDGIEVKQVDAPKVFLPQEAAVPNIEDSAPLQPEPEEDSISEEEEISTEAAFPDIAEEEPAELPSEPVVAVLPLAAAVEQRPAIADLAESVHAEVTSSPNFASILAPAKNALEHTVESEMGLNVASLASSSSEAGAAIGDSSSSEQPVLTTPPSAELIEAVVARVVERMQPKMMEMVTREILRPVVEALVRREIEKQ